MKNETNQEAAIPAVNHFDRAIGQLDGLPEVTKTRPTTLRNVPLFGIGSHLYIVQTFRQKEVGDTIFLEHYSTDDAVRIVLPPQVCDAIARQRDQVTAQSRSRAAKAVAKERMRLGIKPGFMKGKK